MAWEADFSARPFKLVLRKSTERRPVRVNPFASPDSLYRLAARRTIMRLLQENRRLRHRPYYRQPALSSALAEALLRRLESRWRS